MSTTEHDVKRPGVTLLIGLANWPWSAFVSWRLWTWHLVPLGAPAMGFGQAFGVLMTINLIGSGIGEGPGVKSPGEALGRSFVYALILLLGNWARSWA